MNEKIIAKNRRILIFSAIAVVILSTIVAIGFLTLKQYSESADTSYSIIVDDEITVYEGDTFTLVPYLIDKEGTISESRFDYYASDDSISVNSEGVISVNSNTYKDVYVSIFERNTSTTAKVNVNIVGKLTRVLGITFSDLSGNKMLVSGTQNLKLGETYVVDVVTEPRNVEIEDNCILKTFNFNGIEKNVFEFDFSKTNISMTVVGLGNGDLQLDIKNDAGYSLYGTTFEFYISMADEKLGEEILNQLNTTLLSKEELNGIEKIDLSQNVTNLEGLQSLKSLKTIVFMADSVMEVANISNKYCYRIKADLFENYYDSSTWTDFEKCIIPYENNPEEIFVVYHNSKTITGEEDVIYDKINAINDFPLNVYEGYTNYGWLDENGNEVTLSQLKSYIRSNGIHLYAGWNPISYSVVYHIRDSLITDYVDTLFYDTNYMLKVPNDIDIGIEHLGYKFAGWTRNGSSNIFSPNVTIRNGEIVSNLTSEQDGIIDVYDIWEPITYTVVFSSIDGMGNIPDLSVKYNTTYTLPTPSKPGYEFTYWKLGNEYKSAGVKNPNLDPSWNLSSTEGDEILLTPVFSEISYSITFNLNGGKATQDLTIEEGYKKSLLYTQSYNLPYLEKEGYTTYVWYCNSNGKTYGSTDIIVGEFTTACEVTFSAVWTSAAYIINYDCNGGNIDGESYRPHNRSWDDGKSLLMPERIGYAFVEWYDAEHDVSYVPGDVAWTGNLIKSASENGTQFNFKAKWQVKYYDLTVSTGTGTYLTVKVNNQTKSDGLHSVAYNSTITVSYGANTGYSNASCTFTGGTMPAENLTIKSNATINKHNVTISVGGGSWLNVNIGGTTYSSTQTVSGVAYGTSISISGYGAADGYQNAWCSCDYNSMPDYNITISSGAEQIPSSCMAKGTMVLLANGESIAIENLKINDTILAFDHSTGKYIESKILYTYYDYGYVPSIEMHFSNNVSLEFLNVGHGLYDITLNAYVLINSKNVQQYVGHEFLYSKYIHNNFVDSSIKLENYTVSNKFVERYDIVTEGTLNHIANGMLACSDTLVGICNMFNFDKDHTYDICQLQLDIEKYGLYEYEEWSEYLSYEDFVSFNGAYFKIAVGKGLITIEEIFSLLNDLSKNR